MDSKIPKIVRIKVKLIPLKKYKDSENLATGELKKFKDTSIISKKGSMVKVLSDYSILWDVP